MQSIENFYTFDDSYTSQPLLTHDYRHSYESQENITVHDSIGGFRIQSNYEHRTPCTIKSAKYDQVIYRRIIFRKIFRYEVKQEYL